VTVIRFDNVDQNTVSPNVTPRLHPMGRLHLRPHPQLHPIQVAGQARAPTSRTSARTIHSARKAQRHRPDAYVTWELGNGMVLIVGADERRVGSLTNLSTANVVTVGANPNSSRAGMTHLNPWVAWRGSQAWGPWSSAIIFNNQRALYYTQVGAGCPVGAQTGTSQCSYPDDKMGWAILSGIEVKTPFILAGRPLGMFFNYAWAAVQSRPAPNASPSLFGKNNRSLSVGRRRRSTSTAGSSN